MGRQKDTLTLSVPHGTKERLEAIAADLGIIRGSQPSSSGLVAALAEKRIHVYTGSRLADDQVGALLRAIAALVDLGQLDKANSLLRLLLEQGDLAAALQQELIEKMSHAQTPYRDQVEGHIARKEPFLLFYEDAKCQQHQFRIRFARVAQYDRHSYLEFWTDETEGNFDVPELRHNWHVRFDRIKHVLPFPGVGEWRGSLDAVEARFRIVGDAVAYYEAREDDLALERSDDGRELIVTRQVYSSFWFLREVMSRDSSCELLAPDALRQRFLERLERVRYLYETNIGEGSGPTTTNC